MTRHNTLTAAILAALVILSIPTASRAAEDADAAAIRAMFARIDLEWTELPPLPPAPGQKEQLGVGGPYSGIHHEALIVAGGAKILNAPDWPKAEKVWCDNIFVLERTGVDHYKWYSDETFKLPRSLAYGVAVSTSEGLICIGGCDSKQCYSDVFLLKWDRQSKTIRTVQGLPPLPRPLAFMGGAMLDRTIYVVGGQESMTKEAATKKCWALDLSQRGSDAFKWQELPPWPGLPRIVPIVATQSDGTTDCLYVISGRNVAPDQDADLLSDVYRYNPTTGNWKRLTDVAPDGQPPRCVNAGTAIGWGANHILVFGGASGEMFLPLTTAVRRMLKARAEGDTKTEEEVTKVFCEILDNHPGFSRDILAYHTIADTWAKVGTFPAASHVTSSAIRWDNSIVIPSGEIRPAVRTPRIWMANPAKRQ